MYTSHLTLTTFFPHVDHAPWTLDCGPVQTMRIILDYYIGKCKEDPDMLSNGELRRVTRSYTELVRAVSTRK